jgi:hypothetical protein
MTSRDSSRDASINDTTTSALRRGWSPPPPPSLLLLLDHDWLVGASTALRRVVLEDFRSPNPP